MKSAPYPVSNKHPSPFLTRSKFRNFKLNTVNAYIHTCMLHGFGKAGQFVAA